MLRRVLHPIDLSPQSQEGAMWILNTVATPRSSLLLVHVVNPEAGLNTPNLVRDAEEHMALLEEALRSTHDNVSSLVLAGDDEESVAEVAHTEKCSLVAHVVSSEDDPLPLVRGIPLPHLLIPRGDDGSLPESPLFAKMVIAQDGEAAEMNQRGMRSPAFRAARLMPEEYEIHRFHQWLLKQLEAHS